MHASNLLKAVLKPRSLTSGSNSSKDSKARTRPRASTPEMASASLSVTKKATRAPAKMSCLCAPTNHAGSFRCRLHRGTGQQSWGGKPLVPSAPASKPSVPTNAVERRPSGPIAPLPVAVENGVSKRILLLHQQSARPLTSNFPPHTTRDVRPSRLSKVSVARQDEAPAMEAHAPPPKESPGTVRYFKFNGGAGCASAAVLESRVVAIRNMHMESRTGLSL